MSDGAWNWYRVRLNYRRGFIAGFVTCGTVVWVCYMIGFSMPVTIGTMSGGALIAAGVERMAARQAMKDYEASK